MKHTYRSLVIKLLGLFGAVAMVQCSQSDYGCPSANFKLKGTVYSAETKQPLEGISVKAVPNDYEDDGYYPPSNDYEDDYYNSDETAAGGQFEFYLTWEHYDASYSCGDDAEDRQVKSALHRIYFYDPDSTYQTADTLLGIVAEDGYGERDIVIYMNKSK